MGKQLLVSIIIATYNSALTIRKTLESIKNQTIKPECMEILVVDGGSTDQTCEIARSYGSQIIENPYRLPEPAKLIGLKAAKGKYFLIMDSDEAFCECNILEKRLFVLENSKLVKSVQGGIQVPENMRVEPCAWYINEVGDPFTCFVYKTYRGGSMQRIIIDKSRYDDKLGCYIGKFEKNDIRPIGDSVTMMDREYVLSHYSKLLNDNCTTAAIYDHLIADVGYTAFIKGDYNYHYSSASFKTYFAKLKFRIVNNIFNVKGSGYSAAARSNVRLNRRKYLFPVYSISTVLPVIDGIRMSITYKHPIFMMHPVFCWYVVIEIIVQYLKKIVHIQSINKTYAK